MSEPEGAPVPQDAEAERLERVKAWARAWAQEAPPWTDHKWQEVNKALGYHLSEPN